MKLEDGKTYTNDAGTVRVTAVCDGLTPGSVFTTGGDVYDRETGRLHGYSTTTARFLHLPDCRHTLTREAPADLVVPAVKRVHSLKADQLWELATNTCGCPTACRRTVK
jgi:hypothetical protein